MVLQLRADELVTVPGSPGNWPPQNIISYARHWHVLSAHDYRDASVLSLHVPSGKTWVQWIPMHHSQKFVKAAVEAYESKLLFPVPGAHCSSCPSQACLNEALT